MTVLIECTGNLAKVNNARQCMLLVFKGKIWLWLLWYLLLDVEIQDKMHK